jgi:hypothetical protein
VWILLLALEASPLSARIQCEKIPTPGRVKCEVEVRSSAGTIQWADVQVIRTGPLAAPLRGRVGPRDATSREDEVWRWALALVAKEKGSGEITARVRAVLCKDSRCVAHQVDITAPVDVGG